MDFFSSLIRVSIPNYLAHLPIPNSLSGWFHLGAKDWFSILPFGFVVGGVGYLAFDKIKAYKMGNDSKCTKNCVNMKIKKNEAKVVDSIDIEDFDGEKAVFCRCWKSEKFPYCDGSHAKHNTENNDNVGPLIVSRKKN